jgi:hypothetical protein
MTWSDDSFGVFDQRMRTYLSTINTPGEVYMMRQAPFEDCHRVDQLLKKKAEQGVESISGRRGYR